MTRAFLLPLALATMLAILPVPQAGAFDMRFLCSGIGDEAVEEEAAFPHTLKIVYATPDGKFLGNIEITLTQGGTTLLETTCPGPWLLANLLAGRYGLISQHEGEEQSGTLTVDTQREGAAPQQITIRF
ncbi:MAG: hypothetical protein AAGI13_08380 [Pseudomonadota bacterium]